MTTATTSRIVKTPDVCGGDARIDGHRIPVWVLYGYRKLGVSDAELLRYYPSINQSDLEAAWTYCESNGEEVERDWRENQEEDDEDEGVAPDASVRG